MEQEGRIRNIRKKLGQIKALEERLQAEPSLDLSSEQRLKLSRKLELEAELRSYLDGDTTGQEEAPISAPSGAKPVDDDRSLVQAVVQETAFHGEASEEDFCNASSLFRRMPSGRWEDNPAVVEDVAPPPAGISKKKSGKVEQPMGVEILESVAPFAAATQASERLRGFIRATTELSLEAFGTDVIEGVSRKGKWKLTLLVRPPDFDASCEPWRGLLGFLAFKVQPQVQCISIAKLAVVPEERGMGHGHRLVNWCIAMAKKQASILFLSLTSLPQAVRFYKQIGFRAVDVDLAKLDPNLGDEDYDYVEGQVYMEYRCRGGQKAKKR